MSDDIMREGGPHRIRKVDDGRFEASIEMPVDEDGFVGRECPEALCAPAYFKVKPGTGIIGGEDRVTCPYCRHTTTNDAFFTQAQNKYAEDLMMREVSDGVDRMIHRAFGLGPSGRKKLASGFISIEISLNKTYEPPVSRPFEEVLRRDIVCAGCGLHHAVFGLAVWCPDCGRDVTVQHVSAELQVLRLILADATPRRERLGARVAARDVENALEDAVSIFEAVLKSFVRRRLRETGVGIEESERVLGSQVRNAFQRVKDAPTVVRELLEVDLFLQIGSASVDRLAAVFEKRHSITHNLGVIDRKYLARSASDEREGREVLVSESEVLWAVDTVEQVLLGVAANTFPDSSAAR